MKTGATVTTERLILRHWQDSDLDAFHRLNSDERIMHFFPFRRDRNEASEVLIRFRTTIARDGFGWAAVTLRDSGEVIGFAGLARVNFETEFNPAIEIGWRLMPEHWGKGYASEAARSLLSHGFSDLGLDRIVAFAVPANTASTAVMQRIGMRPEPKFDFDMPGFPDELAHMRRHVFYEITRHEWEAGR